MPLFDNLQATRKGGTCTYALVCRALSPDDRASLDRVLDSSAVPTTVIWRRLLEADIDTSLQGLQRHRRGDCQCAS